MSNITQLVLNAQWMSDPVSAIGQLADTSAQEGFYGLQDANLLFAEAINDWQSTYAIPDTLDMQVLLAEWIGLMNLYWTEPRRATDSMMEYLRRPLLNVPLTDDEFNLLEMQLLKDAEVSNELADVVPFATEPVQTEVSGETVIPLVLENYLETLETLADLAADKGWYGLQDANLLLMESLREVNLADFDGDLTAKLPAWPDWVSQYAEQPQHAITAMMDVLRHPQLAVTMTEDEFTWLHEQLASPFVIAACTPQISTGNNADLTADLSCETEAFAQVALDEHDLVSESMMAITEELVGLMVLQTQRVRFHLLDITFDDEASVVKGLKEAQYEIGNFANASKTAGFIGLSRICRHIYNNLQHFLAESSLLSIERLNLVSEWLDQVEEYLPLYHDSASAQLLVSGLLDELWPLPLKNEELADYLQQIRSESISVDDGSETELIETTRKTVATFEDVSLTLPDDVNQELLEVLLHELPTYTQQFSDAIQRLGTGSREALEIAQRAAHTLKGSANTVGIRGLAELTHNLEDILIACAGEDKFPGYALSNALVNAADCLEAMTEALVSQTPPPADAKIVLQEILDWANRIDKEGVPDSDNGAETIASETVAEVLDTNELNTQSQASMMRVSVGQIENLSRLAGENIILNGQAYETMRRIRGQLQAMQAQFTQLQQLNAELEQLIDLKDLSGKAVTALGSEFDALEMDQYNELHTATRRLIEAAVDAREINRDAQKEIEQMDEVLGYQQRLMIDTQEAIMKTRLVPISTISPRLNRALRQTCRLTGKQSELFVIGDSLMIDSDMLNSMVDPLMHLLRNAVDHGIEDAEERLATGKSAQGRITIQFERDGNNLLVVCRDDGRGLDLVAIRQTAEKRGVITPEQDVSEDELKRFILKPNFSTRSQTTQTSGRGVGMDAVYFQIVNMGGSLSLHSEYGQGLTVELRMPLPLSRSHALIAKAGPYRVAIANKGISQVFYSSTSLFSDDDGKLMLRLEDGTYPVQTLNSLLNISKSAIPEQVKGAVLLVQHNDGITAVLVDAITDGIDIVIKNLGHYLKKIPGFMGAAIMGDGLVAPVLDVPELLRTSANLRDGAMIEEIDSLEPEIDLPTIMVVDDSLSQRRALEQLLRDSGFYVITARDGVEAVNLLQKTKPDLVLTDLEMPRMNGIELTAHIRSNQAVKSIPIIMITSRTTQKHHKMAADAGINFYLVKPVREDDLLVKMQGLLEKSM